MKVFVFSYNRGRFLRNCVDSVFRHLPDPDVVIVDDNSDDPEVYRVISDNSYRLSVYQPETTGSFYLGGLYSNIDHVVSNNKNTDKALFIQDDMQIVRDVSDFDLECIDLFFGKYKNSINLHTCFAKKSRLISGKESRYFDSEVSAYFREKGRRSHFSAVGVMNLRFLNEIGFSFCGTEGRNNEEAKRVADPMGFSFSPFMMWLPFPESSKFRKKTIRHSLAEWWVGAGFYPYRPMTENDVNKLRGRPASELPVAENFLHAEGVVGQDFWVFDDATKTVKLFHKAFKKRK